ncbi:zinc finger protein 514-like isoform X2 [Ambystoma mexicanum]|uniref:zinc finger protein 514-like isoform X2 n=1 Tax=Ambystoma mexicanum TaxID=8296 RepID=UPI0037E703AB
MPPQDGDRFQVTFQDVAACFSEEEWKLLHEWQKEMYSTVMKEIHQALISLGPLIAASIFSLSSKEKEDFSPPEPKDPERRHSTDHSPGDTTINAEVLFRTKIEENQHLKNPPDTGRERTVCFNTGFAVVDPDACSRKEEKLETSFAETLSTAGEENSISPRSEFPFVVTECARNEEEPSMKILSHPTKGGEGSLAPTSGPVVVPSVVSMHIKEEEEIFSMDHQESVIVESISSPTGKSMNGQKNVEEPMQCIKNNPPFEAFLGKINLNVPQSFQNGTDCANELPPEGYWDLRGEKTSYYESNFSTLVHGSVHQPRTNVGVPMKNDEFESHPRNALFPDQDPHTKEGLTPYICSECGQRYGLKGELVRHMKTHSGVRPYACTYCERSFFRKANLIAHYSTHTGDKPYMCTFCHKRFNRKYNLNGHIRIHTGERPYKCSECEKSFIWKGDLNQHRRKHT